MGMWQSDITMLQLARHRQTVYLVVFLDDCSRYVVSFALGVRQTGEFVMGALLDGIARFGKPKEVLTDQGKQYFTWRGKSASRSCSSARGSITSWRDRTIPRRWAS